LIRLGLVESRLRLLIIKLEHLSGIKAAHPFVKSIDRIEENKHIALFYIGLLLNPKPVESTTTSSKLDLSQAVSDFVESVVTWDKKTDTMEIDVKHLKR
jgi:poly(A) polymerase Pap1